MPTDPSPEALLQQILDILHGSGYAITKLAQIRWLVER